jgi:hypothetical protein
VTVKEIRMSSKQSFAVFAAALTLAATVAASPALAQQPRPSPTTAAPQAAAPTLGMAFMSAWVNADGTIVTGAGVVKVVAHSAPKYYDVHFNRPLAGCVSTVTPLGGGAPAFATSRIFQDSDLVQVTVWIGGREHFPFQIIVYCAK